MKIIIKKYIETIKSLFKKYFNKKVRLIVSITIVLLTIFLFLNFLSSHHQIINQLRDIKLSLFIEILGLYLIVLLELAMILRFSLGFLSLQIPFLENLIINSYSLMINFFMFGQAGPGLRAVYLKNNYNIKLKKFFSLILLYYFIYSIISLIFIILSINHHWYDYALLILLIIISYLILRVKFTQIKINTILKSLIGLVVFTLFQLLTQTLIFGLELKSIEHVGIGQIFAYSGFANLALFVSLTPAGIGIRESFLLLSRSIHHISSSIIVEASIIDRSVYVVFLLIVLIFILMFHSSRVIKGLKSLKK